MPESRAAAVNYNDRVLDGVRAALGIPRSYPYGLIVPPVLAPVLVVDSDSPPILQSKGVVCFDVAAVAANFSTAALVNVGGAGGILKGWLNWQRVVNGAFMRLLNGNETTYSGAGFTNSLTPALDSRYGVAGGNNASSGVALLWWRNNNPANWGGASIGTLSNLSAVGYPIRIGPFWLDQFDSFSVESSVVNSQLIGFYEWEYYAPVR